MSVLTATHLFDIFTVTIYIYKYFILINSKIEKCPQKPVYNYNKNNLEINFDHRCRFK